MGICESKIKTHEPNKKLDNTNDMKIDKNSESNKFKEGTQTDKRIKECIIQNISKPFEDLDANFMKVSKSVCKIEIQIQSKIIIGTGFFLQCWIYQEPFYCLMSNEHIIENDIINNKNDINIYYDNEFKIINIKLDTSKRYIKSFIEEGLDITVIEILEEDNI